VYISEGCINRHSQPFLVNPDSSTVTFTLDGSGHYVHGTFHVQSGFFDFDGNALAMSGRVVVAAGSGNSAQPSRGRKMNSDVLDTAHFAEVGFAPQSYQCTIAAAGDSTIQVTGTFTLRGTSHELTVPDRFTSREQPSLPRLPLSSLTSSGA
jgi:polyisoprenoid-binding protein YceI